MYYNQNPTVVESDDIASIKAMTFTPGDVPQLTVTFTLHPHKDYNPKTFHLTNGIEHRMLSPESAVTPELAADDGTSSIELEPPPVPTPLREEAGTVASSEQAATVIATVTDGDSAVIGDTGDTPKKGKKAGGEEVTNG